MKRDDSLQLYMDATPQTMVEIARMLRALGVSREYEQQAMSQAEAGQMLRRLGEQLKLRRLKK
jgi:hypothetical protein